MASTKDDFDPKAITQKHQSDIEDLKSRIEGMEKKYNTNEQLADTFCEATKTQSKIKDTITEHIVKQIQENPKVQEELTKQINKSDRNAVMSLVKKLGFAGWTIIVALLSGGGVYLLVHK